MTIAIGIISDVGITFASDSQMTQGIDQKSLKSKKIFCIKTPKMQTHSDLLLAIAGDVDIATMVVDKMEELCKTCDFDKPSSPVDILRRAVREVKKEILEAQDATNATIDERQAYFNRLPTSFILGFYDYGYKYQNPQPHLYSMKFAWGIAQDIKDGWCAIGGGGILAAFLMDIFYLKDIGQTPTAMTAIYVVEQVKKADLHCSGETQLWRISRPYYPSISHRAHKQSPAIVEATIKALSKIEPDLRVGFVDLTTGALKTLVQSAEFKALVSSPTESPPPSGQSPDVEPWLILPPAPGHPSTPPVAPT